MSKRYRIEVREVLPPDNEIKRDSIKEEFLHHFTRNFSVCACLVLPIRLNAKTARYGVSSSIYVVYT